MIELGKTVHGLRRGEIYLDKKKKTAPKKTTVTTQNQKQQNKIQELNSQLTEKYGIEKLKDFMREYAKKLSLITELNMQLVELETNEDTHDFKKTIEFVMSATQDYYNYMANLPEDVRRFFILISETSEINEDTQQALKDVLDENFIKDASPLLSIQAIRPKKYIMQIDAITNHLTALEEETKLSVGQKQRRPVKTTVTLDIPEQMKIEGGGSLSTYDKSIINGVTSLIESGNTVFSIPMLYHAMTGKQNPTVDEKLYDEIASKLESMRRMILSIDLTEESRAQYLVDESGNPLDIESLMVEGYLLPLNKMSGIINGKKTEVYQVIQQPPLYTYSKMKRQLASAPIALLNAPVNNNSTTIPLKTYLLQRIEMMKNKKNNIVSQNILYESVYSELGESEANKTRKMRIRNYSTTILQHYVDEGYIDGYSEYREGRYIKGIRITL